MGKPLAEGEAEVEKCAGRCDFYAEHAEAFLSEEYGRAAATRSYVAFRPLGVVLAVMPWNFPFWQVIPLRGRPGVDGRQRRTAQARRERHRCALEIERVFSEPAFPTGVFQNAFDRPGKRDEQAHRRPADRRRHAHR